MPDRISIETCKADFEAAQRKPQLMETWGYEWGHRLLAELESLRDTLGSPSDQEDHCDLCGAELFRRHDTGRLQCTECGQECGKAGA